MRIILYTEIRENKPVPRALGCYSDECSLDKLYELVDKLNKNPGVAAYHGLSASQDQHDCCNYKLLLLPQAGNPAMQTTSSELAAQLTNPRFINQ